MPGAPTAQTENILANANVADALNNLIAALNSASASAPAAAPTPTAVPAIAAVPAQAPTFPFAAMPGNAAGADKAKIEKTLDTLKNFTKATSPEADNRSKLLLALKPFLKDERKNKIDTAIKYMNAAKIISLFGKNGFV